MPETPYKHKPSQNGNLLFAKLPAEIRYEIWCMLFSIERKGPVVPVHIPTDNATETFFSLGSGRNSTFVLDTLLKTCRLFYQDQEDWMIFYKFNEFQFSRSRECLTYIAAITPSRRNAIQSITLKMNPARYNKYGVKKGKPGNRLRAIAKLCPNLRVLRHEKFFYRSRTLSDWAISLAQNLEPIVASLPLLKEVYIRGGNGGYTGLECHMTLQNVSFTLERVMAIYGEIPEYAKLNGHGEQSLTAVWEILSKRRTVDQRPLAPPRLVKQAIESTPILTLGQDRRHRSRVNGVRQNVRHFARGTVPDFILGGTGTVKDIRFPSDQMCPELLIGTVWYHWDAIFSSNGLSEYHSKSYVSEAAYRFRKKYVPWVYFSGTSNGRRHGDQSPQSKLINCIWRLNWQDRAKKLDILGELYKFRNHRPRQGLLGRS